jgi:hypothetical protein
VTFGARQSTVEITQSSLNVEAMWTARNDRTQGLAHPVITTGVSGSYELHPVKG